MIELEIISDRHEGNLCAAQVECAIDLLCKAIGAPEGIKPEDGGYEADGRHGWLGYDTDEHNYHRIILRASNAANLQAIMLVAAAMAAMGCTVYGADSTVYSTGQDSQEAAQGIRYKLEHCNDI